MGDDSGHGNLKRCSRTWVPLLFFLGLIFLVQVVSALIGPNTMMGLIYILAGAAK